MKALPCWLVKLKHPWATLRVLQIFELAYDFETVALTLPMVCLVLARQGQ
jgi:hypothetical protein